MVIFIVLKKMTRNIVLKNVFNETINFLGLNPTKTLKMDNDNLQNDNYYYLLRNTNKIENINVVIPGDSYYLGQNEFYESINIIDHIINTFIKMMNCFQLMKKLKLKQFFLLVENLNI